jgi:hypothetical protein
LASQVDDSTLDVKEKEELLNTLSLCSEIFIEGVKGFSKPR